MSSINVTTNFKDSNGVDLGKKLVTKDYLISVYPSIAQEIGITPELWVWGLNSNVQLGTNDSTIKSIPVTSFSGGTDWKQVSCGEYHTAAIKTDGTLWVWGNNQNTQLGINDTTNRSTPITTFSGGTNWRQVSCGYKHTAAIKTDGTLWTWGYNLISSLGTNDNIHRSTPVTLFGGGINWTQVSCGEYHTAAIKTDGTLWLWGAGGDGQLGNNATNTILTPVTTFAGGTNWKQVSCSDKYSSAIKTDGTLWTWGYNAFGRLGTNDVNIKYTPVTTFAGGTNWKQVSVGYNHTAAIKTDGTLWVWGRNNYGQLGVNDTTNRSTPITTFSGGTNWKGVNLGLNFTTAIKIDGTLWVWGRNDNGAQLGINNFVNKSTPVTTFAGGTNWKQVSCGDSYVVAIESSDFI